ncbi:MAG TPA: MBL fold metallo-hydrolase [Gemmatimonadales bacterium]|nr:MBL fold metallo-hydrolase [Gemmatimonadales bacterium]
MRLVVLGSGSKGNALAVAAEGAVLLVDAGFSARELERRAAAAGLALDHLVGIALTHEHGDHATGAPMLAKRLGVPLLCSAGTYGALLPRSPWLRHRRVTLGQSAEAGPFVVEGCPTSHDAAEPLALRVRIGDGPAVGVAYDLGRPSAALRWFLRELSALVLEANHDEVLLRTSEYPAAVRQRIAGAGGHLSNRACAELLGELVHPGLAHVVLAHLSERCNTEVDARGTVGPALAAVGFGGALHVARQHHVLGPLELSLPVAPPVR